MVSPVKIGAVMPPAADTHTQAAATIPFRQASAEKVLTLDNKAVTQTANAVQLGPDVIQGEGLIQDLSVRVAMSTAGNAAAVAFTEDGQTAALVSLIFSAPGGDVINVDAVTQAIHNKYDAGSMLPYSASADAGIQATTTGTGATGGSFMQWYRLPMSIGYRSLVGLLGNQDQATKYRLRNDLAGSASVYSTAPTALGTATVSRYYRQRTVPAPTDNFGSPQQVLPDSYGIVHYQMSEIDAVAPAPGNKVHYMTGLGNVWRRLILVWRQNGSRASAEGTLNTSASTTLTFAIGDSPRFTEDFAYRRRVMFDRYGFDAPAGVLVYDFAADFGLRSGEELGDDYLNTANLTSIKLTVNYPSGIGSTNNTLTVLKDSLWVPAGRDLAALLAG